MHDFLHLDHIRGIDHDHDDGPVERLEDNALWIMDHIELKSVGIDIGSAGTQVTFSRLKLRRMGEDLSSRYVVTNREPLYYSPVALTPYVNEDRIDEKKVWALIADAYAQSGLDPAEIDTGVVLLTGEAIRRDNARAIGEVLAARGGEFVCAAAGHNMEAVLAAYGSGAALASYESRARVLNIDIGGGTTKLAVTENGHVLETAALYIGGRLVVFDEDGCIVRFDEGARNLADQLGLPWMLGHKAREEEIDTLTNWMAQAVLTAVTVRPLPPEIEALFLTPPIADLGRIDGVMFSGGVGEYVYGRETRDFHDLGRRLGWALKAEVDAGATLWPLLPAGECIRATVIGASSYSLQVSGNTIYVSDPGLLPQKNLQVLHPSYALEGDIDPAPLAEAIRSHFQRFDVVEGEKDVALAFRWHGSSAFDRVNGFVEGVKAALPRTLAGGRPVILILDGDLAQTVGMLLREDERVTGALLVIDGITLQDFDFIDIGRRLEPSNTVPVTVKSLVFR